VWRQCIEPEDPLKVFPSCTTAAAGIPSSGCCCCLIQVQKNARIPQLPVDIFPPRVVITAFAAALSHSVLPKNPERSKVIAHHAVMLRPADSICKGLGNF